MVKAIRYSEAHPHSNWAKGKAKAPASRRGNKELQAQAVALSLHSWNNTVDDWARLEECVNALGAAAPAAARRALESRKRSMRVLAKRHVATCLIWIDKAFHAGWRVVRWCDVQEAFTIVSPAYPRRPSVTLGHYTDERAAWRGAANLARLADSG
jgi:hypothetical protein